MPRVKHHHSDAILDVRQISYEEYIEGKKIQKADPFFSVHSSQEQAAYLEQILPFIQKEPEKVTYLKKKTEHSRMKNTAKYRYDYEEDREMYGMYIY